MTIHSVLFWCEDCQTVHGTIIQAPDGAEVVADQLYHIDRMLTDLMKVMQDFGRGLMGYGTEVMENRGAKRRRVPIMLKEELG